MMYGVAGLMRGRIDNTEDVAWLLASSYFFHSPREKNACASTGSTRRNIVQGRPIELREQGEPPFYLCKNRVKIATLMTCRV